MPFELQLFSLQGQILVRKTGLSRYQDNENGIIEFEWNDDELMRLNQPLILQIFLQDEIEKKNKVYRIKTSTLK
jgi:hypothetical protein